MLRPKAVVAHPIWGRGGAEAAAMWIIEALSQDFDVTVYTRGGFDPEELNRLAGTALSGDRCRIVIANQANAWPVGTMAHASLLHSLRCVGAKFDLRVTASGVMRWGRPAMHFISSVIWNDTLAERFDAPNSLSRMSVARRAAWRVASWSSGERARSLNGDCFIANSRWTAQEAAPFCPGPIHVVPPAVPLPKSGPPWESREEGVLVFGRVSPEKRIETCIHIMERVRAEGRAIKLCIAGPDAETAYANRINSLCRERSHWIQRLPLVLGPEKQRLLGRFRYGLSACEIEAFGIATAEMAASGMLVIVPEGGGQREIIQDPLQRFTSVQDASDRLLSILRDSDLQKRLRDAANGTRKRFGPEQFIEAVRALAMQSIAGASRAGQR
ncbi:MAG: glycosyltransferase family 4 protein [Rhodomicrobium sp.]